MARYSSGGRTSTNTPSTTTPALCLHAAAAVTGAIREIGIFNTTTTATNVELFRVTTAGTATGLTEEQHDPLAAAPSCTATYEFTADPTKGDSLGYRAAIGAAVGAGIVWTFGDTGVRIPVGTANGVGVFIGTGTGQHLDVYVVWDE